MNVRKYHKRKYPLKAEPLAARHWFGRVKLLALFALISIVVWSTYSALTKYMLPINTLYVTGNITNLEKQRLQETVQKAITHGFFAVDVNAVKEAVGELAWVQNVSVRRIWPDSLQIDIREHTPVARWGSAYLINERGDLFLPDKKEASEALPLLLGPQGRHRFMYKQYAELQAILGPVGVAVRELAYDARHAMRVTLDNQVVLYLGRVRDVVDNYTELLYFAQAYQSTLAAKASQIEGIDLRYTNGFAVHWKPGKSASVEYNKRFNKLRT